MKPGSVLVIDTNVLLVANKQHEGVSARCIISCVEALDMIRKSGVVVLDDAYEILREYSLKTTPNTGNRVGDVFLKWLYQNLGNPKNVERIHIEPHAEKVYEDFPNDDALADFDRADRKFVAVAARHAQRHKILQAADSKWIEWSAKLAEHRIVIEFLCPQDVKSFLERKRAQ